MQGFRERETIAPTHEIALGSGGASPTAGRAKVRAMVEMWIEAAIDFLDRLDGDPDLEDGADAEPSLGAIEPHFSGGSGPGSGPFIFVRRLLPGGAAEPFLTALHQPDGEASGRAEYLRDGGGLDQTHWGAGDRTDREQGDDNGIADHGGLTEQHHAVGFGCIEDFPTWPTLRACARGAGSPASEASTGGWSTVGAGSAPL